jgi:prephenate dehydrogenase/chorismate mutase
LKADASRRRIKQIDEDLMRLAAERVAIAREIGKAKREAGHPTVDFAQERQVLENVRDAAKRHGFPQELAEEIAVRLISAAVGAQESDRMVATAPGKGAKAVVVGGAGRMGSWLVRFLGDAGYDVQVLDKALTATENEPARKSVSDAALVLLAVPPLEVARLYKEWVAAPPAGVVADACSIKSPLVAPLRALQRAGAHVASFHPLFGPALTVLRGADVVVCRTGDEAASETVRRLFAGTTARVIDLDLDEHDRKMAEVLTLAHATALSYAAALGEEAPGLHSTTARRLQGVADAVAHESAQVYYEIQVGNPHSDAALARLHASVSRLRRIVHARDLSGFTKFMDEGRARLERRREAAS